MISCYMPTPFRSYDAAKDKAPLQFAVRGQHGGWYAVVDYLIVEDSDGRRYRVERETSVIAKDELTELPMD